MNFVEAAIMGIIEGVTEFLPISSTFHLIIASKLLKLQNGQFLKLFEVFIQSGAIASIVLLYFKEVSKNGRLLTRLLVSFIPTALIGLTLHRVIKDIFFEDFSLMFTFFVSMGLIFIIVESLIKKNTSHDRSDLNTLSYRQAFLIGLVQSLAVIPGVSRSGVTIIGLMLLGLSRSQSATYSFLLAVPTIFAAGFLDLLKTPLPVFSPDNLALLAVGFITAFISAYLSTVWLINFLKKHSLIPFALYRFIAGAALLLGFQLL